MEPKTIACIDWTDASHESDEVSMVRLGSLKQLRTVGLLVRETPELISVAMEYCGEDDTYRDVTHIPKVNVIKIKRIKT